MFSLHFWETSTAGLGGPELSGCNFALRILARTSLSFGEAFVYSAVKGTQNSASKLQSQWK